MAIKKKATKKVAKKTTKKRVAAKEEQQMYILIECPDSELPVVRQFGSLKDLAARVQVLLEKDVAVVIVRGTHLPVSERDLNGSRHVADKDEVIRIPQIGLPVEETEDIDFKPQENFFLGADDFLSEYS